MKITIKAEIGVDSSLYAGDIFKVIAEQMSDLSARCYSLGELADPEIPKHGTIEHPDGGVAGEWKITGK